MRWLIFLVFFALTFAPARAKGDPLVVNAQTNKFDLTSHLTYLRDPEGSLTLDDVASSLLHNSFINKQGNFNFGITSDVIWLRLEIQGTPLASSEWWLELAPAYIGEVTLYQIHADGTRSGSKGNSAGIMRPLSIREFKTRHKRLPVNYSVNI